MSLLGYVSTLMQLLLSGAYASAPTNPESRATNGPATQTMRSGRPHHGTMSEGHGQMGRIVEAMLSGHHHHGYRRTTPTSGTSETNTSQTANKPSAPSNDKDSAAPKTAGSAGNSAAGLTNALSHVTNANAQAVLEALLGAHSANTPATAATSSALLADLASVDLTEAEARALAEGRRLANRDEEILQRIAAVANPDLAQQTAPGSTAEVPQDFAQALVGALMAQINAAHPALGAYSTLSLAAVSSGNSSTAVARSRPALFV